MSPDPRRRPSSATRDPASREDDPSQLELGVEALEGVGPVRARHLARLGLHTLRDVVFHLPRRLEAEGRRTSVAEAVRLPGERVHVRGTLRPPSLHRTGRRRTVVRTTLEEDGARLGVLFFNQPWMRATLGELAAAGGNVELSGRVVETRTGPALAAPRLGTAERPLPEPESLTVVYPTTEGVGQELLRGLVAQALERAAGDLEERLDPERLSREELPALGEAVEVLHRPPDAGAWRRARRRVALEGLLPLAARLHARLAGAGEAGRALPVEVGDEERRALLARSPFAPTGAQVRCLDEILADLRRTRPMRRLLQGDVGSGKTWVALLAAAAVARAGGQVAFLAPTELLAEQHHLGSTELLEGLGVEAALLTGSTPGAERRALLERLAGRTPLVVFGTHALFSADVRFACLALAVIDEQQRFGVAHKQALLEKGEDVHVCLATATPIPRTLALALYGDLSVSLLDELPPGRGQVRTSLVAEGRRAELERFVGERLAGGERAFWICPGIEPGEDPEAERGPTAVELHRRLARGPLGAHGVELVHGRVPSPERSARIARFRDGRSRLLVGTTVVEVGIDVPAATLCVVEGAERFGLAQLHQLRGRVGRGGGDAWCLLLAAEGARERLELLARSNDGFEIAEEDLRQRGMGELAGLRQAGFTESLPGAGPEEDLELLLLARRLVEETPELAERYGAGRDRAPAPV